MALAPGPFLLLLLLRLLSHFVICTAQEEEDAIAQLYLRRHLRAARRQQRERYMGLYGSFDALHHDDGFDENFEPSVADPRGKITCWGNFDTKLVVSGGVSGFDLSRFTAQQICAKPQYGGDGRLHIGAWCRVDANGRGVVFDPSVDARPNRQLDGLEMKRFCLQRCYCDSAHPLLGPPKIKDLQVYSHPISETYEIKGAVVIGLPQILPTLGSGSGFLSALAVVNQKQAVNPTQPPSYTTQYISLPSSWNISCPGNDLPDWLPAGWTKNDFEGKTRRLCASIFTGGSHNANEGGYCEPSTSREWSRLRASMRDSSIMRFRNTFIPDPAFLGEFTRSSTLRISAALQLWCRARCTCEDIPDDSPSLTHDKVWAFFDGVTFEIDVSGGGVAMTGRRNGSWLKRKVFIPPGTQQQQQQQSDETCSVQEPETCAADSSIDHLASLVLDASPRPIKAQHTCGQPCHSSQSCISPEDSALALEERCICRVVEAPPPGTLVFDPVSPLPIAYCLSMAMVLNMVKPQQHQQRVSFLGGRSLEQPRMGCLCNATYASQACCDSPSKLVWEDPEMRIPFTLA